MRRSVTVGYTAEQLLLIGAVGDRKADEDDEQDKRAAPDGAVAEPAADFIHGYAVIWMRRT